MRLLTFIENDERRLGALVGAQVIDLTALQAAERPGSPLFSDMRGLIEQGPDFWRRLAAGL